MRVPLFDESESWDDEVLFLYFAYVGNCPARQLVTVS